MYLRVGHQMGKRFFSTPTAMETGIFFARACTSKMPETSLWDLASSWSLDSVQTVRGFCIGIVSGRAVKRQPLGACCAYRFRAELRRRWVRRVVGRWFDVHQGTYLASLVSLIRQGVN